MNSAVVNQESLIVVNIIVADPTVDPAPYDCILVAIAPEEPCNIGWTYDSVTNSFTDPNPPPADEVAP
jgi:hypothetical protein